jgi:PEP-CTERM motif
MSQTARGTRKMACALALLVLTASAVQAAPLIDTGPYSVNLVGAGRYVVSARVETGGAGYIYTYTVAREANYTGVARHIELGIAEDPGHAGLHDVTNATVISGPGSLMYDLKPHLSETGPDRHNYVWTFEQRGVRMGLPIQGQQIQQMSFESTYAPVLADWSFRELFAQSNFTTSQLTTNIALGLGQLPVPGGPRAANAPEPSSLTLAAISIVGLGFARWRRKRRIPLESQPA